MIKRAVKIGGLIIAFLAVMAASAYMALTLIIKSEGTVIVPELAGKEIVHVLELLTSLDLDIKVQGSAYNTSVPKHHVIYQQPEAGAEIKKGRDVKLILSKGPETVILNSLRGLTYLQARNILEDEGLCEGIVSHSFHQSIAAGFVIAQYPYTGAPIARSRCVDLLISNGRRSEAFIMPRLDEMPIDKAVLMLESAKLRIDLISSREDRGREPDVVLAYEPAAGERINRDTLIRLVVNRPTDAGSLLRRMHLFRHQTGSGYLRKRVRIEIGPGGDLSVLFNEFVEPGEEVWLAVPGDQRENVLVYENDNLIESANKSLW